MEMDPDWAPQGRMWLVGRLQWYWGYLVPLPTWQSHWKAPRASRGSRRGKRWLSHQETGREEMGVLQMQRGSCGVPPMRPESPSPHVSAPHHHTAPSQGQERVVGARVRPTAVPHGPELFPPLTLGWLDMVGGPQEGTVPRSRSGSKLGRGCWDCASFLK